MTEVIEDATDVDRLDSHFAARRAVELEAERQQAAAAAYATRATARSQLVKRAGMASLLGGAGLGLALFGGSFLLQPKIVTVTVPGPERIVPGPQTIIERMIPALPEKTPTKAERDFTSRPEYQAAEFKGRIVESIDGRALSFEGGKSFWPAHIDPATGTSVIDPQVAFNSAGLVGDYAACVKDQPGDLWTCSAVHNDAVVPVVYKTPEAQP